MINGIKPMRGSGDGITEYAYNMYLQLKSRNWISLVYSIDQARKNDVVGLVKVNSTLKRRAQAEGKKDYDIFHVVNQEVGFAAKAVKSARASNNVVSTIHDLSRFESGLHIGALQRVYNKMVRRNVIDAVEHSDFLLFDSKQTMADVKKKFGRINGKVVNIGIDRRFFSPSATKKPQREFVVGYVGSFAYHKNAIMLLKAASYIRGNDIKFRVYGVGSEKGRIAEYVNSHKLSDAALCGFAPENKKVGIYDSFDVFVFPSLYEGFGLPILEAQARGLPVIVYKRGRIPEEVRRYCLEAKNEEHMSQMITGLRDNGYSERLRKKAMEYARSFTWERCARETFNVYSEISR